MVKPPHLFHILGGGSNTCGFPRDVIILLFIYFLMGEMKHHVLPPFGLLDHNNLYCKSLGAQVRILLFAKDNYLNYHIETGN